MAKLWLKAVVVALSLRSVCEWLSVRGCLVGLACMAAPRFASNLALRLGLKAWLKA